MSCPMRHQDGGRAGEPVAARVVGLTYVYGDETSCDSVVAAVASKSLCTFGRRSGSPTSSSIPGGHNPRFFRSGFGSRDRLERKEWSSRQDLEAGRFSSL